MRKTITYTVMADGRDKGKVFLLTELPADATEKWAIHALLAIGRAGIDLPPDIENDGYCSDCPRRPRSADAHRFS